MVGEMLLSKPTKWGRLAVGDILAFIWTEHPRFWLLGQSYLFLRRGERNAKWHLKNVTVPLSSSTLF